jgi:hypothetical protein
MSKHVDVVVLDFRFATYGFGTRVIRVSKVEKNSVHVLRAPGQSPLRK